ncbi:hypothetical protein CcrC1_gp538 [Caulobacter phage C1]|nr:hypothetical protein CcrC1_gp045 [Caulobacter phage C1]UTU08272.1 hypothetical protein CcrC2_gp044 [Caulobacter phage C2]UTU08795.1 hypothetical protein CcrJ4_gp044 [Caulobacter phage J4]UTU09335.1 hypothetical protein CcrBL47_gp049 [Caulobacter phage BL47]UTU09907.1 hypothetical protein CcrRB23_gp045 [Caulobacter phage RB23]WGN96932.1 hypothetical protein [Bertelyvirus sp.]
MTFHHNLMSKLDAAQMAGEMTYAQHADMRATLRASNMRGQVFTSMDELRKACKGAGRDFQGRFA